MTDVLADTETYGPVYAAIAHVWGERCSDYEPGCPCCDAWAEYDRLSNASAENEKLRAALEGLSCDCPSNCDWEKYNDICPSWVARAALGGKDE